MDSLTLAFARRWRLEGLILALCWPPWLVGGTPSGRTGFDLAAVLQLVLAVHYDRVSWLDPAADSHGVPGGQRHRDHLYFHGIVWLRQIHVGALRPTLDRRRGHDSDVVLGVHQKMDIHELVGEQNIGFVSEDGLQLIGACG